MKGLLILSFIFISCRSTSKELHIYPLHPYQAEISTGNKGTLVVYFYVENFLNYNKDIQVLRRYADSLRTTSYQNNVNVDFLFYRKTDVLNDTFQETKSDILEWHGKDLLYSRVWRENGPIESIFKNGEDINPEKINYQFK